MNQPIRRERRTGAGPCAVQLAQADALSAYPDALAVHTITVSQVLRADRTVTSVFHYGDLPEDVAVSVAEALVNRYAALRAES